VGGATEALDLELARYAASGRVGRVSLEAPRPEVRARARTLGPAEQRVLRVEVALVGAARDEEARAALVRELDLALAADPDHVGALALKARLAPADALPLARRAVAARPEDARAWALLARALPADAPAAREAALRRALALAPGDVDVAAALAAALVAAGRAEEALPLAGRAARAAPWDPRSHEVHAAALAAVDRCADALAAARRAVEVAWEVPEEVRRRAAEALERVEQRCAAAASP
jgi:hypothetical protein